METLIGFGAIILVGVLVFAFAKHVQEIDLRMRADAVRAARVERHGNLLAIFEPQLCGFMRWKCTVRFEPYLPDVVSAPANTIINSVNGEAVSVTIQNPRLANAIAVVRQSMQFPGAGSDQLITAEKFNGSTNTWQDGVNYLKENFGIVAMVGRGTYVGSRYASVRKLYEAVIIPLPHAGERGGWG